MMKTVTEAEVREQLPKVKDALARAIADTVTGAPDSDIHALRAAWQVAMLEQAASFAKEMFATSRVDFALAAKELYSNDTDDKKVNSPDDS